MCTCTGHFCQSRKNLSSLSFLSILERKHFGGLGEKIPTPHHLFFFLSTHPNTLQKKFSLLFSLQSFPSSLFHLQTNKLEKLYKSHGGPRYLFTIPLKNSHLFKITELVVSFCFNFFSNSWNLNRWKSFSRMVDKGPP